MCLPEGLIVGELVVVDVVFARLFVSVASLGSGVVVVCKKIKPLVHYNPKDANN